MTKLENKFIEASRQGDFKIVKECIKQNVNINVKTYLKETALLWASIKKHFKVLKLLIENGADVDVKNHWGDTPLLWASFNGGLEIVKLLIINGADINVKNNNGQTVLSESSTQKNTKIFNYLVPLMYDCKQFEQIYNELEIEQKHILFKHFLNNEELLKQVNISKMKGFIKDINKYKGIL